MKLRWVVTALMALPASANAICKFQPLEPQLRSAQVVYVGTVVRSELVTPMNKLQAARSVSQGIAEVRNTVAPELVYKGDSALAPVILSRAGYSNPRRGFTQYAEIVQVSPGDSVLVVAQTGETPSISLCSASRTWDLETSKVVIGVLGPAP